MKDIELINTMISRLKNLKSTIQKKEKLSIQLRDTDHMSVTAKRYQQMTANLDWQCMAVEKEKTDIARLFEGSILDVSTEEKEYRPSGWHTYKG